MTTTATCRACGTVLRAGARFATRVTPMTSAETPPIKQVTLLFADVVHSMDIAAAVGAERSRETMSALLDTRCRW